MSLENRRMRVLVVEDEMMIAMMIEDMLEDLQYTVVGPALHLDEAVDIAGREALDLAILDVNLGGERSFPVAEILRKRGIPFVFATGYGVSGLTDDYQDVTTLKKPFTVEDLEGVLRQIA